MLEVTAYAFQCTVSQVYNTCTVYNKPDQLRVIFGKHKIDARRYLANVHKNRFELKNFDCMLQRLAEIMQKLHGFA